MRASKVVKDEVTSNVGNTAEAMGKQGAKKLKATYDFAIHTHGSIGPSCAVAEFKDGKLTSWSASQATHNLRKQLAQMFGMPADNVRCIYLEGSGCYGRNGHEDAAADAALLAKAVGQPVRVQWSRADEHGWDPKGPPTLIDLRAALDASGGVTAWESEFFIPQQTAGGFLVPLVAATLAGMPADEHIAPGNIFQNSAIPYKFANIKTVCHRLETTPFRPSWIRTPGRMQNTYANECFMDELAAAAERRPDRVPAQVSRSRRQARHRSAEPRRRLGEMGQAALAAGAIRAATWSRAAASPTASTSWCAPTSAAVAEVEVKRSTGEIRVTNFYLAHDCGQIINPDGLKNQIEGNVIQTVSRTLIEELKFDRSRGDQPRLGELSDPDASRKCRRSSYDLIDRPNERPWGAGEPAAAVVPSAISNAVFDATGVRLRSVPFTPDKVKAAMKGAA